MNKEEFDDFVYRLKTQDNRATRHPIFVVQEEVTIVGLDPQWSDDTVWFSLEDSDIYFDTEEEVFTFLLENDCRPNRDNFNPEEHGFVKTGYRKEWRYVNAHFTELAAERWIRTNKHRHEKLRIYVDSQYRCDEFNEVVNAMKDGRLVLENNKEICGLCNYAFNGVDDINTYCLKNGDKLIHEHDEACDDFVGMK